jgi:hypothetical protein
MAAPLQPRPSFKFRIGVRSFRITYTEEGGRVSYEVTEGQRSYGSFSFVPDGPLDDKAVFLDAMRQVRL